METSVQATQRRAGTKAASFIQDAYKKGYQVPGIEYQEFGIVAKELWVKYPSKLRIIPGHDSSGKLYKQNINVDCFSEDEAPEGFLSDTFYMCKTVTNFGERKMGLITDLPPGSSDRDKFDQSPIDFFQRTVSTITKTGRGRYKAIPDWNRWLDTRQGILPYPKISLMFQALGYSINGRPFTDGQGAPLVGEDDEPMPLNTLVIMSHKLSWSALARALVDPLDPSKNLDAATNNKYGALAEAEGNMLYLNSAPQPGDPGRSYLRPSVQLPSAKGWTKDTLDLPEDFCQAIWVPWDQLLRFYTAEEQIQLLAMEFGADSVNYLFQDNPAFAGLIIPEHIAAAGLGRYAMGAKQAARVSAASYTPKAAAAPGRSPFAAHKEASASRPMFGVKPVSYTPKATPEVEPETEPEEVDSPEVPTPRAAAKPLVDSARMQAELAKLRKAQRKDTNLDESTTADLASSLLEDDPEDEGN